MNLNMESNSAYRNKTEEIAYARAASEIESNNIEKGLHAKLWVQYDGDEKKVKVAYIKIRAEEILSSLFDKQELKDDFNTASENSSINGSISNSFAQETSEKFKSLLLHFKLIIFTILSFVLIHFIGATIAEMFSLQLVEVLIIGLCLTFLVSFLFFLNRIWYLANEANKYGSLWALGCFMFFPIGLIIAFARINKIAKENGWINN